MTIHLHRADRSDLLADQLAELLANPLPDPFATEVVAVAEPGMQRWLAQRLSHRLGTGAGREDGVAAGIRFPHPRQLIEEAAGVDDDQWHPDRLQWTLLDIIDASLHEPWCADLARHLGEGLTGVERELRRERRLGVASMLARLFRTYAANRPDLIATWSAGQVASDVGEVWQAQLWRAASERIAAPPQDERLDEDLFPERISIFGTVHLPLAELQVLSAIGRHREVHLWVPHVPGNGSNALNWTLGRQSREWQELFESVVPAALVHDPAIAERPDTVLGRLQSAIAHDRPSHLASDTDRTVQIHACHGPARQVEVLRDVVVGLLEDDPTLEPRDILVVCPDVDAYAPLVRAMFGLGDLLHTDGPVHPGHRIPIVVADRSSLNVNPLLELALTLLRVLGTGRQTSTDLIGLVSSTAVQHKFDLDDDAVQRLTEWIVGSGVRWGLDAAHRKPSGIALSQNTWRSGIDRVVVAVAMAESPTADVGGVLPFGGVTSNDIDLVGAMEVLVDRLSAAADLLTVPRTAARWAEALTEATLSLGAAPEPWQQEQFHREIAAALADDGARSTVTPAEVLTLVERRWTGRPGRSRFRTGPMTVCSLVPMRAVPHRVVCLVGLDDGDFPRGGAPHGDNLLTWARRIGEPDARADQRQAMLDAVMAATETLVITYTGADAERGQPRPPAVPLGELRDELRRAGADVVISHPLQSFDQRNLTPGALIADTPFSFDPAAIAGARVTARPDPTAGLDALPSVTPGDVTVSQLEDFLIDPAAGLWRQRMGVRWPGEGDPVPTDLPLKLSALGRWDLGDRLLRQVLAGTDPADAADSLRRAGLLPPGALGTALVADIGGEVWPLALASAPLRTGPSHSRDIDVVLPGGRRLTGTIAGVRGAVHLDVGFSKLGAKQRLRAWVRLLALKAAHPDIDWTTVVVAPHRELGTAAATYGPIDASAIEHGAMALLAELVEVRDEGLRRPLPLPANLAASYAEASQRQTPASAERLVRAQWSRDKFTRLAPDFARIWGRDVDFDVLERAGFTDLAVRIWAPLLAHEVIRRCR